MAMLFHARSDYFQLKQISSSAVGVIGLLLLAIAYAGDSSRSVEGGAAVQSEDLEEVLQLVIDLKHLEPFYHPESPNRRPLKVIVPGLKDKPRLRKFGEPVVLLDASQANARAGAYLEITKIAIEGKTAAVEFRYPIEGVVGNAALRKSGSSWVVTSAKVVER